MKAAFLKFVQLGRLHLAIDLGQRLLAAHRQDRVAEGDQDADDADQAQPVAGDAGRRRVAQGSPAEEAERVELAGR